MMVDDLEVFDLNQRIHSRFIAVHARLDFSITATYRLAGLTMVIEPRRSAMMVGIG
jgi:hypothetical protein